MNRASLQSGSRPRASKWLPAVLCWVVALAVYLPTVRFPLVWDDVDLVQLNRDAPLSAFGQSFWHGHTTRLLGDDPYYRPLVNFSLRLDRIIGRGSAWYYHLVNCLLHSLNAVLVYVLTIVTGAPVLAACGAGMIFGVHPMLADSVGYVSGRTDIICALGIALMLGGLLRWLNLQRWRHVALIWGGLAIALFAKEAALIMAVICVGIVLLVRRRPQFTSKWVLSGGCIVIALVYLVIRRLVLGSAAGMNLSEVSGASLTLALNNAGRTLVFGLVPFSRRVFAWDGAELSRPTLWLLPLGVLVCLGWFLVRHKNASRDSRIVLWSSVVALVVPASALAQFGPLGRCFYLPAVAFVPFCAVLLSRLVARRRQIAVVLAVVSIVVVAGFVPLAIRRSGVWRNGFGLYQRMTVESPGNPAGYFNLAFELRKLGDLEGAISCYRQVIALDSSQGLAWSNLGASLQAVRRLDEAEQAYRRAIALMPKYALAYNNLGIVLHLRGDASGAIGCLKRAAELDPGDAGIAYNLARMLQRRGSIEEAVVFARRAVELDPGNGLFRQLLAELETLQRARR